MCKFNKNKMNNPDVNQKTPAVNEFMANPTNVSSEIANAIKSGNLSPEFVEDHLGVLLKEARQVNAVNLKTVQEETSVQKEAIKSNLLVKLATFEGGEAALSNILRPFCEDNNLELYPERGWAVEARAEDKLSADWISNNGKFAIKVNSHNIFVYQKMGTNWFGLAFSV
jgi:hypothetical protein